MATQLGRQRVDDAGADAVQAAGGLVVALLELAAGVEHREDDFERALLRRRVLVDRNAAAVVGDGDRAAVLVERDDDVRGEAVHRLVDGVVEHLPDEMVQPGGADAADVHAGPLADRLEPFENGDVFRGVVGHSISRSRMKHGQLAAASVSLRAGVSATGSGLRSRDRAYSKVASQSTT